MTTSVEEADIVVDALSSNFKDSIHFNLISAMARLSSHVISLDSPSSATYNGQVVSVKPKLTYLHILPLESLKQLDVGELYLGDAGVPASVLRDVLGKELPNVFGKRFSVNIGK